jgi:SHS2 domain-containing protein
MPFTFLEEIATADIAFEAWGRDLEETFSAAADATMNVMIEELDSIRPLEAREIRLKNDAMDMLLFDFLQDLIYYKDAETLMLRVREVKIREENGHYVLRAKASGEKLDPDRHRTRVDVKAVTLHRFELIETEEGWKASVILDI